MSNLFSQVPHRKQKATLLPCTKGFCRHCMWNILIRWNMKLVSPVFMWFERLMFGYWNNSFRVWQGTDQIDLYSKCLLSDASKRGFNVVYRYVEYTLKSFWIFNISKTNTLNNIIHRKIIGCILFTYSSTKNTWMPCNKNI